MDLKALSLNLLLIMILNYLFIDEIVGVKNATRRPPKNRRKHMSPKKRMELREEFEKSMKKIFKSVHVFYKDVKPIFKYNYDPRYVDINLGYYATLYDTHYKIPLYSAYTLNPHYKTKTARRDYREIWRINKGLPRTDQARPVDLKQIGAKRLNRGHLFPQLFAAESIEMRKYSSVMTNMALQYADFNIKLWNRLESGLHDASMRDCKYDGSTLHYLTGVIPGQPFEKHNYNNINIPSHFWTAVCCDTSTAVSDKHKYSGWSFAYIVRNVDQQNQIVNMFFVEDFLKTWQMSRRFSQLFKTYITVKECLFDPSKTARVVKSFMYLNKVDRFNLNSRLKEYSRSKSVPLRRPGKCYNCFARSFSNLNRKKKRQTMAKQEDLLIDAWPST